MNALEIKVDEKTMQTLQDLLQQAAMFDMYIDEDGQLKPNKAQLKDTWIDRWSEKVHLSDNMPQSPDQAHMEGIDL